MSHTPGPWHVFEDRGAIEVNCKDAQPICELWRRGNRDLELANARLIAAAPDLLCELEHLVVLMEPVERVGALNIPGLATLNGARAAIKKARGE